MAEFEVFRITPEVGEQCYEYAESARTQGRRPNEQRFTNVPPGSLSSCSYFFF